MSRTLLMFYIFFLCFIAQLQGQANTVVVSSIIINGNHKVKKELITRELDFSIGDSLDLNEISERFQFNRNRLLSTSLLRDASFNIRLDGSDLLENECTVLIDVEENWFIYPFPAFYLADRNFNVWWKDYNASLSRVNYGIKIHHINLTGWGDNLKLGFQTGYTQKYLAEYIYPYLNKKQTWGLNGQFFYATNKEVSVRTVNNKQDFYQSPAEDVLLRRLRLGLGATHRQGIYWTHDFNVVYHRNRINDIISKEENTDFFSNGKNEQMFVSMRYDVTMDRRNFSLYPKKGELISMYLEKNGMGFQRDYNSTILGFIAEKYTPISRKSTLATRLKMQTDFGNDGIPFYNDKGMGYLYDYASGYELYIVDGLNYILSKNSLRYGVLHDEFDLGKVMPLKSFRKTDTQVYLTAQFDLAYGFDPPTDDSNVLNQKLLLGYGPGVDIILYHNFLLSFTYSLTIDGYKGLYFSSTLSF